MSQWHDSDRFARAVLISKKHPDDVSLLEAVAHLSRADPYDHTDDRD